MTITRTSIAGIHAAPEPLGDLEQAAGAGWRARNAALAAMTVAILLLVAL